MLVAALQFDVRAADVGGNAARVEEGLREAARVGCALVVLPEMWPTSFVEVDGRVEELLAQSERALADVARWAHELGLVVAGSAFAAVAGTTAKLANRLTVHDRGVTRLRYDKVHLFTPTAEPASFVAGTAPPPTVDTSIGRMSGVVCYDLRFPEPCRAAFHGGAELLVVPAQWPITRAAHWRALVLGRAVEGQFFVVAANRCGTSRVGRRAQELVFTGNSLIVSPHGEVLAEGRGEPGLVIAEVDLAEVRRLRVRVPVAKDERPELYGAWRSAAEQR